MVGIHGNASWPSLLSMTFDVSSSEGSDASDVVPQLTCNFGRVRCRLVEAAVFAW